MKVIIIEDEPHARNELKRLLAKLPAVIEVLECLDSVEEAVEWFRGNPAPDLAFLDIQLSDGLSFEIFSHVEVKTPVIFTTAYDEYAIRAFQVNSIDYLLKPVKLEALDAAIKKYEALADQFGKVSTGIGIEQIEKLLELHRPEYKTRFIARVGDQIKHIDIKNVAYFAAEDNEVMLVTHENNRYVIEYTLDQLNGLLPPGEFFRANRSYIVTPGAIRRISKYFNSRLHLELVPATEDTVLISRVRVPEFMKWIDK